MSTRTDMSHETDAYRLFVQDRAFHRLDDAHAERLARQIQTVPEESGQPLLARRHHSWHLVHLHEPHFTH